jgi:hypothetical protein
MERGVELLAGLVLLLTSASHITAPGAWARLFEKIRASGDLAGLANAAISLPLALIIVPFHSVWSGPGIGVTLIGWALLLKGTLHLLFPQLAQRSLSLPGEGTAAVGRYRLAGVLMLPLALFILWIALR